MIKEGFIPKGSDLHRAFMTIDEAQRWCTLEEECKGFTFQSNEPMPGAKVQVWFKSTDRVAPGQGWYSCVKGAPTSRPRASGPVLSPSTAGVRAAAGEGPSSSTQSDAQPVPKRLSLMGMLSAAVGVHQEGSLDCAALALLTRKPLHFEWWLNYHIELGISHFFIHVEDTPELVPLLQSERYGPLISMTVKEEAKHFKDNYWTLQDRQRAHVNASLERCRSMGIEWLFHVDDDELIWLDKPFREIVAAAPKGTTNLTFSNLEAIPTTMEAVNYFEHIHTFTKKRMLAYVNGKPAGRATPGTKLDGPHRFSAWPPPPSPPRMRMAASFPHTTRACACRRPGIHRAHHRWSCAPLRVVRLQSMVRKVS